jgi:hypothetical protein
MVLDGSGSSSLELSDTAARLGHCREQKGSRRWLVNKQRIVSGITSRLTPGKNSETFTAPGEADRDPTIFAALDYFADLTLQRYLGSPCQSFSDQPDSIANLESALDHGTSYRFAFSPSSTRRRISRC